jgi:hypothetical protein
MLAQSEVSVPWLRATFQRLTLSTRSFHLDFPVREVRNHLSCVGEVGSWLLLLLDASDVDARAHVIRQEGSSVFTAVSHHYMVSF